QLVDPLLGDLRRDAVELGEHPDVLPRGQETVSRSLTAGDHVDSLTNRERILRHVVPRDGRLARGRQEERREDFDQRRLPGAIRAEQAEQLALPNLDGDPIQRGDRTELLVPFARGALSAEPPLFSREHSGQVTCLDRVRHGDRFVSLSDRAGVTAAQAAIRCRYRVIYPAIRLRIRTLRTSVSSETIFLLCS